MFEKIKNHIRQYEDYYLVTGILFLLTLGLSIGPILIYLGLL